MCDDEGAFATSRRRDNTGQEHIVQRFWDFSGTARNGLIANGAKRELQQQMSQLRGGSEYLDETRDNEENRNHSAAVCERRGTMVSTTIFIKIQQHSTTTHKNKDA